MQIKPTVFLVTDVETTLEKRIVFDVAWRGIDRKGREYCNGSYLIKESFAHDVPYFKEKLGLYFEDVWTKKIKPTTMQTVKEIYNNDIMELLDAGHKVIFAAYNGQFDAEHLGKTCNLLLNERFLVAKIPLLCIWNYWAQSVPLNYFAPKSKSGQYLSTSAQSVYAYEFFDPSFKERHIAWSDVGIECEILLRVLRRKKKMPLASNIRDFFTVPPWVTANKRVGIPVNYYKRPAT